MPLNVTKTFYNILGVSKDASQEELRNAWLALARKHHPDKTGGHKGSEEKLKAINEAYDTLKKPEKRQQYDETLAGTSEGGAPFGAGAAYGTSPQNGSRRDGHFEFDAEYADIIDDLFRQKTQGRQRGPRPGRDLEVQVSVSLKEAVTGTRKSFRLPTMVSCRACSGIGAAPGTKPQQCPQCKGDGHISSGRGSLFVMSHICPLCRGRGEVITTPCPACGGAGFEVKTRTLSVAITAGVKAGTRLRLAGQGEPGEPGAPEGDLFVVVTLEKNELFQIKRNDIMCEVPITFTQAVLGGSIQVPTLHGKARLKVPAGTQTGTMLRMRGQGLPSLNGGDRGDQLVKVIVEIPTKVAHDQVATIQKLDETIGMDAYPKHRAFAETVKRWCATQQ